jgi:hypothetical protein
MTMWHDQAQSSAQALTRRDVREAERRKRAGGVIEPARKPHQESANIVTSRESGLETVFETVHETANETPIDEPVSYVAQIRPQVPNYRARDYSPRDYSSEGRARAPFTAPPASSAPRGKEHPLTRRQLRALREVDANVHAADPVMSTVAAELESPDVAQSYSPPVGHWSTQAAIDDETQRHENTVARTVSVGTGGITANALVLPSAPLPSDLMGPITSTGEILITGTINLPQSLGSTGSHPRLYDRSEVDYLLEASDREDVAAESAPVRAIRAISTHTSTQGIIVPKKAYGNKMLLTLSIVAAAMAIGVVVLFAAGMIFKIF